MKKGLISAAVVGVIGMAVVPSAMAATETTWRLDDGSIASGGCGTNTGNSGASRTCLPSSLANVKATAFSFSGTNQSATLSSASVVAYSGGVGVTASGESGSPHHSIDNSGRIDGVLLSFWDEVTLTKVTTRWVGPDSGQTRDSDFSVLAYTGTGAPAMTGTAQNLLDAGWKLVNHYNGTQSSGGETKSVNNEGPAGSALQTDRKYWLVTAYDPHFGAGSPSGTVDKGSGQYDFLKLYSVSFKEGNRVPEPGSLVLVGVALAGLWSGRRRAKR
jgi:hypothetical protein